MARYLVSIRGGEDGEGDTFHLFIAVILFSTTFRSILFSIPTGKPPDFIAFGITLIMTSVLAMGASKSVIFNHTLNAINLATWVFVMAAGLFYVDTKTWSEHQGFLPYGWSGVSFTFPTFLKKRTLFRQFPHFHFWFCSFCFALVFFHFPGLLRCCHVFLCIYRFRYYRNHRRGGPQSAKEHSQGNCRLARRRSHCLRQR